MKRLISFILSACMLFTCMVVPANADYISPELVLSDDSFWIYPDDDSFWIYTDNEPEVILPDSSSTCANGNHSKTQDVQVSTEYKTKNSSKHYEIAHYETKCKTCGEVLDTYTEKIAEVKHYYKGGSTTCWYCEYNKKCTHEKTYTKYGEDTYKQYNSKYHKCTTEIDIICEYCGKTVDTDKETTKEKHYYTGLVCKYCDYEKECDHEETRTKSCAVEYTYVNEKNHYVWYNTKVKICQECGEEVSRTGKKQLQAHYYENGVCTSCGYEKTEKENVKEETVKIEETTKKEEQPKKQETTVTKKEPQYIEEMKAGKLYAVGNDGCLYKRTYDANQAIGYTDTYAYTPTTIYDDFTLSKGEILIEKGNYLYDTNGNKASATVSTMKTCDIRINQLKSVIEQGAENAYSVGTITASRKNSIVSSVNTKVTAYKAVKQGKKTLNQISEYKASYKAKTGNENSTVKKIQEKLYEIGFTSQDTEGYYGDITLNNVAYFQIVNNLDVTGWVDTKTYKLMYSSKVDMSDNIEETEEKLNTLFLSQNDIQKGVKVVTVGFNQYYDCTTVLNEVFLKCAVEAKAHKILYPNLLFLTNPRTAILELLSIPNKAVNDIYNLLWFKSKVENRADWDIKREKSWKKILDISYPGDNGMVLFYGKLYTTSELGNMMYGYTGTAMEIPEEILYMGGGYAATGLDFILHEGYGDLEDRPAIKEGIEWYKREN